MMTSVPAGQFYRVCQMAALCLVTLNALFIQPRLPATWPALAVVMALLIGGALALQSMLVRRRFAEFTGMESHAVMAIPLALLLMGGLGYLLPDLPGVPRGILSLLAAFAILQCTPRDSLYFWIVAGIATCVGFSRIQASTALLGGLYVPAVAGMLLTDPWQDVDPAERGGAPHYLAIMALCLACYLPFAGIGMVFSGNRETTPRLQAYEQSQTEGQRLTRLLRNAGIITTLFFLSLWIVTLLRKMQRQDDAPVRPPRQAHIRHGEPVPETGPPPAEPLPRGTPRERIIAEYHDLLETMRDKGMRKREFLTPAEYTRELVERHHLHDKAANIAAYHLERAVYSHDEIDADEAENHRKAAAYLAGQAKDRT